jgi:nucleotide-binding universal stress UspA family protein
MRVQFRHVICAIDFSEFSSRTAFYGEALAGEFGARLYACHVIPPPFPAVYGEGVSDTETYSRRLFRDVREHLNVLFKDRSVDWEDLVTSGHPTDEIVRIAGEKGADMVISASHGRSGLKRLMLGSVTEGLMRELPCPLLVVQGPAKRFAAPPDRYVRFKRILVGCDFSTDSSLAVDYGLSLAQEFESELHLVHVIEPPAYKSLLEPEETAGEGSHLDLRDRLAEELSSLVPREALNWCTPIKNLMGGQPHEELTKYAVIHKVDLIILGVRGRSLVEALFVGSTTDRVVRQAPCPVLVARPTRRRGPTDSEA